MSDRILVFVNHFYPYRGGLENAVLDLYATLKQNQPAVEIDVVCNDTERAGAEERVQGLNVYRISCWNMLGKTYSVPRPISLLRILKRLKGRNYLFVNTHTRFFVNAVIGYFVAKSRSIPLIHTEHGASFTRVSRFLVNVLSFLFDQTWGRMILRGADAVVTPSQSAQSFAVKLGAVDPTVIPNGIHVQNSVFNGDFSKKEPGSLIFVGRLVSGKGVQDLLSVLKDIPIPWKLHVVGDGNYAEILRAQVLQTGLTDRIHFTGLLQPDEVHKRLAHSQIFVNPSYTEGFSMTTLEAGLEGCAVIATDAGGPSDIIDDGVDGYIIPGFNNRDESRFIDLRDILERLLRDPEACREMGQRLREKIKNKYDWGKTARAYYDLGRKLSMTTEPSPK